MYLFRGAIALILGLVALQSYSQESVNQQTNAPAINWYQLNTPNFRVLYPQGFEIQAQRVANNLETIREPEAKSMGVLPKKISVILQNNSSLSNGFVTVAPRRSEFYAMPPQNYNFAGTNDWLDLLSSHEYRHIVQFQRSITGFNKALYYVFGQQATAGMAFAAAPQWFWEGDAVATETAFTKSGRGRIPNFDLLFRTNIMEGRTFNYHKQYLRSYKNNIPDHYVLGYNMVSYLRKKTNDPLIWEKIAGRSWNVPFIPFAFSNAIKKETGLYVKDLYKEMAADRKKDYEEAIKNIEITPFETITKRKTNAYTDYSYPQTLGNGDLLVMKSGIGDIDQLVVVTPDGVEKSRYIQGLVNNAGMISATDQRAVWNEIRFDPRWIARSYSVIKGYDFGIKEYRIISTHSRYSAAALSPDGRTIATIETSVDYKIRIAMLDYATGQVLQVIPNPDNDLLTMPRWTPDGKSILILRTNSKGKTISTVDVATGAYVDLLPYTQENVGYPIQYQNFVLFNSPISGIDNIYAINVDTKERFQVTSSKYASYNPAVSLDGKTLYFNNQTRDGLDLVKTPFDPSAWKKTVIESSSNLSFQHLVNQEADSNLFKNITQTSFNSKRYHRASGMINPHSWGPYFVNSLTNVRLGILSQDILSTTSIDAGYVFDINERTGAWKATASYQGAFPIVDASVSYANRSVNEGNIDINFVNNSNQVTSVLTRNLTYKWEETNVEAGLRVPLVTTSSRFLGNFSFGNAVGYTHVSNFTNSITGTGRAIPAVIKNDTLVTAVYPFTTYVDNGNLIYNHFSASLYRLQKQSRRDINSKWGQSFVLNAYSTPYGGNFTGSQFSFYSTLFFPGLFKHHSLWGYWAYQYTGRSSLDKEYIFSNQIPLPRGQTVFRFEDFYTIATNYTLPVWYPDIAIGPVLNVQRIRANFFFDYGYGKTVSRGISQQYTSIGTEIKFDINVMRFLPQFNVGFRYSYGLTPSVTRFELLIGAINIF
ncbi:hypothetical protein BH09BAC3_BH09BAC3_14480 [soil metagenome]